MSLYSLVAASQSSRKPSRKTSRGAEAHSEVHQLTQFHQRVIAEAKQKLADEECLTSQRHCPLCRLRFLQVDVDGVQLDYCRNCHCWWFDASELMHFKEAFDEVSTCDLAERPSSVPCPICASMMRIRQLRVDSNLMVHACPNDHGVLLEDREFERALELSEKVDGLVGHLNEQHLAVWRQLQACLASGEFSDSNVACVECGDNAVVVSIDGVEIDYCTQCQSCWFDTQELRHFTRLSRDVPGDQLASRATGHSCPKCCLRLRQYQFHRKSNVFVESCPAGHGVYLRGGQFPVVLRASE